MPASPNPSSSEELIARALSSESSEQEAQKLAELCRRDPSVLDSLAQHVLTERLLKLRLKAPDGVQFSQEVRLRIESQAQALPTAGNVISILKFQRFKRRLLQLAATLLTTGALWWLTQDFATARIQRTEALGADELVSVGQALTPGEMINLRSGLVALRFRCGAEVILEGPAEFKIEDAWHGFLKKGRVVAHIGRFARGFTINGPGGKLVDLGTRFAVSVKDEDGMELHVLEGLVEATPQGDKNALRITKNEAVRLENGRSERMANADGTAFVTALPPKQGALSHYIHWGFEENGNRFLNSGKGLGAPEANLVLNTHTPNDTSKIPGPFGDALQFNGAGAYAESPFKGIGGSEPRTVAFWVKVPSDFRPADGYAIVSWGSRIQQGAAWQISVNPVLNEGPIGRLRVGVHNAPVVGTTDLRDDQWHHCAVVMYGGTGADLSTHVLLYIDGRLEPAARKAVMPVLTDTDSPLSHGISLGRNLNGRNIKPDNQSRSPGFRGGIDEVYIFDTAISMSSIRNLMERNSPK